MDETRWLAPPETNVPTPLREAVGGHPLVAKTLVRRGVTTVNQARAFLDPNHYMPAPPDDLPDLARAVTRLAMAVRAGERICVWGDFDADGQTATTVLVSTLETLGADVIYHIPVRATESHGVNIPNLKIALDYGTRLLLTCDTGVSAREAIAYARAEGMEVIITDHHELPAKLPDAYAIVNPHRLPPGHPLSTLPGVGVAYKVAAALARALDVNGHTDALLDLVALGIVADVATLEGDTRYLLQRGLDVLRHTERLGLRELMRVANLNPADLNESHIGFRLGPRLNALGRLGDANVSVEFLTTKDPTRARVLAGQLEGLNTERQRLCDDVFAGAEAQIERDPSLLDYDALVLSNPHWPAGVIGIVASRLVDRYHKPTVLIATPPGELGRGSARSVEGCDIITAITQQSDLLQRFGGHTMAAGLAIEPDNLAKFREGLSKAVHAQVGKAPPPTLHLDAYVPLSALSLDFVDDLRRLAPFGAGNPELVLATRNLRVASKRQLGRTKRHLRVMVKDEAGTTQPVFWWHWQNAPLPDGPFDLAYTLQSSTYLGQRELQIVWHSAREVAPPAPVREVTPSDQVEVIDYRREPHPQTLLTPLIDRDGVQIWREAVNSTGNDVPSHTRHTLTPSPILVVWTTPPSSEIWRAALARVTPQTLYLVGNTPGLDAPEAFLKQLAGLVKHTLSSHQGQLHIDEVSAALAHTEATVRKGLAWLEAKGHITLGEAAGDVIQIESGGEPQPADTVGAILADLKALLAEAAAYRAYFRRADKEALVRR